MIFDIFWILSSETSAFVKKDCLGLRIFVFGQVWGLRIEDWGLRMGRVDFNTARHTYDPNDKTLAWV